MSDSTKSKTPAQKLEALQTDFDALKASSETITTENSDLKNQVSAVSAEKDDLEKENEALKEENTKLKKEIEDLKGEDETDEEAKNLLTPAGRADFLKSTKSTIADLNKTVSELTAKNTALEASEKDIEARASAKLIELCAAQGINPPLKSQADGGTPAENLSPRERLKNAFRKQSTKQG
jgi:cell division protein FtsB